MLYSAFTYYCGFKVNSGEYKLMGLAPYGQPIYRDVILRHLIDLKTTAVSGSNMDYFNYCQGLTMTNRAFDALFGGPPRPPESDLEQRHMDLAASIQAVTEEVVLRLGRDLHRQTGMQTPGPGRRRGAQLRGQRPLLREGPFDDIWIQPAAGDAGGALGAALFVWHQLLNKPRQPERRAIARREASWGRLFYRTRFEQLAERRGAPSSSSSPSEANCSSTSPRLLAEEKGGRLVPGPDGVRPPGAGGPQHPGRSALAADAGHHEPEDQVPRELSARSPRSCLQEQAHEVVRPQAGPGEPLHAAGRPGARANIALPLPPAQQDHESDPDLRRRVNVVRSSVPAVTHVDYSARVQTVDAERNPPLPPPAQPFTG